MSDFNYQGSYGLSVSKAPTIRSAVFGDGYEQRVTSGINSIKRVWQITFDMRTADIEIIDAFLTLKKGVIAFTWTPFDSLETKVKCSEWTKVKSSFGSSVINTKFEEVFE